MNRATLGHGIDDSSRLDLALRLPERGHYGRYHRAYDRGRADVAAAAEVEHPEADVGRIEQRPVETVSRMTLEASGRAEPWNQAAGTGEVCRASSLCKTRQRFAAAA